MKILGIIIAMLACLIAGYLLSSLGIIDAVDQIPGNQTPPEISLPTYLSFVSVLMTSVTAVLAALAIGIGVIAAYTFRELKDEARKAASDKVEEQLKIRLSDASLKDIVREVTFENIEMDKTHELEDNFDPDDQNER